MGIIRSLIGGGLLSRIGISGEIVERKAGVIGKVSVKFTVFDKETNNPIPGAPVNLFLNQIRLGRKTTDTEGIVLQDLELTEDDQFDVTGAVGELDKIPIVNFSSPVETLRLFTRRIVFRTEDIETGQPVRAKVELKSLDSPVIDSQKPLTIPENILVPLIENEIFEVVFSEETDNGEHGLFTLENKLRFDLLENRELLSKYMPFVPLDISNSMQCPIDIKAEKISRLTDISPNEFKLLKTTNIELVGLDHTDINFGEIGIDIDGWKINDKIFHNTSVSMKVLGLIKAEPNCYEYRLKRILERTDFSKELNGWSDRHASVTHTTEPTKIRRVIPTFLLEKERPLKLDIFGETFITWRTSTCAGMHEMIVQVRGNKSGIIFSKNHAIGGTACIDGSGTTKFPVQHNISGNVDLTKLERRDQSVIIEVFPVSWNDQGVVTHLRLKTGELDYGVRTLLNGEPLLM